MIPVNYWSQSRNHPVYNPLLNGKSFLVFFLWGPFQHGCQALEYCWIRAFFRGSACSLLFVEERVVLRSGTSGRGNVSTDGLRPSDTTGGILLSIVLNYVFCYCYVLFMYLTRVPVLCNPGPM